MTSERFRWAALALGTGVVAWLATLTSPVRSVEAYLSDVRTSAHSRTASLSDDIVILAIDDRSMEDFPYTSPIDRFFLAEVVEKLDKSKARAIGLDIVLDRATLSEADNALKQAMERAQAPLILVADPGAAARGAICQGSPLAQRPATGTLGKFAGNGLEAHGVLCIDRLDDVFRAMPERQSAIASFSEALFVTGAGPKTPESAAPRQLPSRHRETWPVPFSLMPDGRWPFATYSAADLPLLPADWFNGKVVLVGQIVPYSGDWQATPLRFAPVRHTIEPVTLMPEGQLPGVVLHAYALQAMIDGQMGPGVGGALGILAIVLGVLCGVGIGLGRLPLLRVIPVLVGTVVAAFLAVYFTHGLFDVMVPFTGFVLGLVASALASFALMERAERTQRRMIHASFAHFLAPEVVDQLARTPSRLALGAEESEITALFTDLAGFTRLVDTTDPDLVTKTLNGYLDIVVDLVVAHGGVVDKIVGDAVHALFSAPLEDPDHRANAIRCAVAIEARTEAYRARCAEDGVSLGETRIGANSGRALVGNFGSTKRFDYTAHGSVINVAARLEAENKRFGTRICISEATWVDVDGVVYRPVGPVTLRGVDTPLDLFEVSPAGRFTKPVLDAYKQAFGQRRTDPEAAKQVFRALLEGDGGDALVAYQLAQLDRD
ncbi:MAG: adenylate/guanylate cyclase domain-containing protein [Pseudomonadota bacterium]